METGMDRSEIDVESLTPDQIEQLLIRIEESIGDARALQGELLAAVEAHQTPLADGYRSLKEWVKARLDVSGNTASDLVRLTRTGHHRREGSVDRRVATASLAEAGATDSELDLSKGFDIAGVCRLVSQRRRFTRADHRRAVAGRYVCLQPSLDEGIYRIHGQLPGLDSKLVEEALTTRSDQLPPDPEGMMSSVGARKADALVAICQDSSSTDTENGGCGGLSILVDAAVAAPTDGETGVFLEAGPRVGVDAIEEILCTGTTEVIARTGDGTPLAYGRKTRVVPPEATAGDPAKRRVRLHHCGLLEPIPTTGTPHHPLLRRRTNRPRQPHHNLWFHHHVAIHGMGMTIDPDSLPQRRRLLRPESQRGPP